MFVPLGGIAGLISARPCPGIGPAGGCRATASCAHQRGSTRRHPGQRTSAAMTAIVFAGPSIYGFDEAILAAVELRPPAACGDILRACRDDAARIGLVDGIFEILPVGMAQGNPVRAFTRDQAVRRRQHGRAAGGRMPSFRHGGRGQDIRALQSGRKIGRRRRRGLARAGRAWLPAAHRGAGGRRRDDSAPFGIGAAGRRRRPHLLVRNAARKCISRNGRGSAFSSSHNLSAQGGTP